MKARGRQYSSTKSIFALLTVKFLASGTAEYIHRHRHGIQSKTYDHPRFGESSIRYCAFNQYFDDREGRCMIIPGGGIAISIDESTTCSTEALRGHPHRSRNYYICRKSNTILAECDGGKRFENRLKRCTIDTRPTAESTIDEEDYDSHHHPYDHLHLPACQRSGRFPVPQDNCTSFYTCTSNGFRFFRSIHKCPASTGFDPFDEICTTERACYNDGLGSTTAVDDRVEIFGLTTSLVTTAAGPSVDEAQLTHPLNDNYSLNISTMRFTTSASPSLSTSGYHEAQISVSFVPPNTSTTEKITTATSFPDSIDEVVGILRLTKPTTNVYEHMEEASPFTSTTYGHSFGLSEQTNMSELSPITVATNEIVDTSTAKSVLQDKESTANTSGTNSDQFLPISTDNKIDEFTDQTTIDHLGPRKWDETRTSEANELGIGSQVSYSTESATDNTSEKWSFDKNIEGAMSTIADEIPLRDITEREFGTSLSVLLLSATSVASTRDIQSKEAPFITTPSGISSADRSSALIEGSKIKSTHERITLYDAVTLTTPVDNYASSRGVSHKNWSSDGIGGTSISPTEIVDSTPVTLTSLTARNDEATSTQESKIADRYRGSFSSFSTITRDNEKSTTAGMESAMSTIEPTYITEVTEKFDSTPVSPTSLTTPSDEATSIPDSNCTTEEESTTADRYHGTFSSLSPDTPDNEKSTNAGMESTISTTEPADISEVTEKVGTHSGTIWKTSSTDDLLTSIDQHQSTTSENSHPSFTYTENSASGASQFDIAQTTEDSVSGMNVAVSTTSITPSATSEPSELVIGPAQGSYTTLPLTFPSFSADTLDNEKSTNAGTELAMSTTESEHISEVTEKAVSPKITWNSAIDDLFTSIEQHQSTTGENPYSAFTDTSTLGASQFGIAQTTGNSNPDMNVAVSTTTITPSLTSEPTEDGQAQASYKSASNISEYPTTVEHSAGSTNSLSTTMPSSSD